MNLFALSGIIVGISSFFFGYFVFLKNPKNKANQVWLFFSLSIAIWGFGGWRAVAVPKGELEIAYLWWQVAHIGVILIPVLFLHFIYSWLGLKKKLMLLFAYFQGLFFLGINFYNILTKKYLAGLFIVNHKLIWDFNSFYMNTHYHPDIYWLFVFLWFGITFYAYYELYIHFKKSEGLKHDQIKYFFLASLTGFLGGGPNFLPVFGIHLYPILNFLIALYPAIMSYAIIKYRLWDIWIVLGKGAVYLLIPSTAIIIGYLIVFLNGKLTYPIPFIFLAPLISLFISCLTCPILNFYKNIAAKYFYYTAYSLQQTIQKLTKSFSQIIELDKLTKLISYSLLEALKIERIGIILRKPEKNEFYIQKLINFEEESINNIIDQKSIFFIQYFQKTKKPLVREEIKLLTERIRNEKNSIINEEKKTLIKIQEIMEKMSIAVCLPVIVKDELIGLIILGDKISKEAYTVQDINLLVGFSTQMAVALNNALLYRDIWEKENNLEKLYKLTIRRELEAVELKSKIEELKKGEKNIS